MWRPPLSGANLTALHDAIRDARRPVRHWAQSLRHDMTPLPESFIIGDGEVTVDAEAMPDAPSRQVDATLLDPDRRIRIDKNATARNDIWFSKLLRFWVDVWVPEMDEWVSIPLFTGPVQIISRRGAEVTVTGAGKDVWHLEPYIFYKAVSYGRNNKVHDAWKKLFQDRDESDFRIESSPEKLGKAFNRVAGQSPWKSGHKLARSIGRQAFCDGMGTFVLRELPKNPVWVFEEGTHSILTDYPSRELSISKVRDMVIVRGERYEKAWEWKKFKMDQKANAGATSIHIEDSDDIDLIEVGSRIRIGGRGNNDPEVMRVSGAYTPGSRTINLTRATGAAHGVGAPVEIRVEVKKTIAVYGDASLPASHPFSAQSLTGGKRKRVEIINNSNIHKRARANERAAEELQDIKNGLDVNVPFTCVPQWLLEEGDPIAVEDGGDLIRTRAMNFTLPLTPHDEMSVNSRTRVKAKKWRSRR